jgi:hypothetical protein
MDNPQYVKVDNKKYKINTSYKIALKCDDIIKNNTINDYEKTNAIIYLLFGKEALKDKKNQNKILELAYKYLSCGQEPTNQKTKTDMNFQQDFRLIVASFKSDYGIDLLKEDIDWWTFWAYLNGLKEDCILNRVRELRETNASEIKDVKERQKIIEAQHFWALKEEQIEQETYLTEEQQKSVEEFYKSLGF